MVFLFGVASFLSAGLVFLVQPLVGKLLLPQLGGSPSVWNTTMLFFQTVLLAGYAYADVSVRALGLRRQPRLHLVALLLPLLVLPVGLPAGARPSEEVMPALWLLHALTVGVGAPFLLVSTSAPLLQRWFSATDHRLAPDPYFLYAAGNAGSLLALLAYPFVVEPTMSLDAQARLWSSGYVLFLALTIGCVVALQLRRAAPASSATAEAASRAPLARRRQLKWVLFAFIPSSLMLGVTTFISTDIAAFPLLWVAPLALYLVTFIAAFGQRPPRVALQAGRGVPALVLAAAITMVDAVALPTGLEIALHLLVLSAVGLAAHGRLAADRPEPAQLTRFYLLVSVGGALGGLFNGLLAPLIFDHAVEYPLVLAASLFLVVGLRGKRRSVRVAPLRWRAGEAALVAGIPWFLQQTAQRVGTGAALRDVGVFLAVAVGALVAARRPLAFALGMAIVLAGTLHPAFDAVLTERTFFGVVRVEAEGDRHVLVHGTTVHGWQDRRPGHAREPQNYYHSTGPVGDIFSAYGAHTTTDRIAVVGLGTGTLAAYGRRGQTLTFYEIDPAVVDIASDPRLFSYLRDSAADVDVVLGDGRLRLADAPDRSYDMILLDAFSSDAVPVHLMTSEAVELYRSKLAPGGLLVFHISNRHVRLEPVLAGIAARQGLAGAVREDGGDPNLRRYATTWFALAESEETLVPLTAYRGWRPVAVAPREQVVWTDQFSDIVRVLMWR